jgi:hypothetical protein
MGRACSMHEDEEECIWGFGEKPEGKRPLVSNDLSLHIQVLWQDHKIFHPHILAFKACMILFVKLTKNYTCWKTF